MSEHAGSSNPRWRALDLLRLVAVVLMVQGHVFTALLDPSLRHGRWALLHDYVHGLTAPIFFFSSGLAFGVATLTHWSSHLHWGPEVKRRLGRYAWLLFIGYMLSLPETSFRQLWTATSPEPAQMFFRVDALENIAVSLILLQGLVWLATKPTLFTAFATLVGLAFVWLAPIVWRLPVESVLPLVVAAYFNVDTGSLFPLFPWTGFLCAGAVAAHLSNDPKTGLRREHLALGFGAIGLTVWGIANRLERSGVNPFGEHDYWKTSPIFFFTRLGIILVGFAVLCALERAATERRSNPSQTCAGREKLLHRLSQETLVIYVAHLFIIYGSPLVPGMTTPYRGTLSIEAASMVTAIVLVASTGVALVWGSARRRWPERFVAIRYGLAAAWLLIALVKP